VLVLLTAAGARAQVPPLPLPTSTTTTTAAPEPLPTTPVPDEPPPTAPPETVPVPPEPALAPVPPFPTLPVPTSVAPQPRRAVRTPAVIRSSVADALPGAFGLAVAAVLLVAGLFVLVSARARQGGPSMLDPRRRWRLLTGIGSLALAAIVGLVGWLKLSLEPAVNRQIPYLASAGMALVVLAAIGGSLLVADQLRSDAERIDDLEEAVRRLMTTLEPLVEAPPRRRPR
jgi:hypothetical protein